MKFFSNDRLEEIQLRDMFLKNILAAWFFLVIGFLLIWGQHYAFSKDFNSKEMIRFLGALYLPYPFIQFAFTKIFKRTFIYRGKFVDIFRPELKDFGASMVSLGVTFWLLFGLLK